MTEKDFSRHITVNFNVDHADSTPHRFRGVPGLPALKLVEFADLFEQLDEAKHGQNTETFKALFNMVLTDESAAEFIDRMSDKKDPISIAQVMDILPWIMEQYGMRPTKPSDDSSATSSQTDDGTSSTDAAPESVSTHSPSLQTVS